MDFTRSLKYPFHNIAKVMSIVLVMTIAFVACIALITNTYDWTPTLEWLYAGAPPHALEDLQPPGSGVAIGFAGLVIVALAGGWWLNGYSVSVVRAVMNGIDTLPDIKLGVNLGEGFWLFLSSVWYMFAAGVVCTALIFAVVVAAQVGSAVGGLAMLLALILGLCFCALAGWAYFIGMARYAAEGSRGPLFQMLRNMRAARQNLGAGLRLILCFVALSIIYSMVQGIVNGLLESLMGADIVVAAAITLAVYFFFNLFQHFSSQHLIAQYAMAVGVGARHADEQDKDKVDFV